MRVIITIIAASVSFTACARSPMQVMAKEPVKATFDSTKPIKEVEPCVMLASTQLGFGSPLAIHNADGSTMIPVSDAGYTAIVTLLVPTDVGTKIEVRGGYDRMIRKIARCV